MTENTIVEQYLKERGRQAYFLPKFHCELNPIERVWAQAKVYCRAYTNFTLPRLHHIINPTLDSVTIDMIHKYARKARDYEKAYREGNKAGKYGCAEVWMTILESGWNLWVWLVGVVSRRWVWLVGGIYGHGYNV